MRCTETQDNLSGYVSGELDRPMVAKVEAHLDECAPCRDAAAGMRDLWADLSAIPSVRPPAGLRTQVLDALDAVDHSRQRVWWRRLVPGRAPALAFAALALILMLGSLELVQSQRASLGPISILSSWLSRPTTYPTLAAQPARWSPALRGAVLLVPLKASGGSPGTSVQFHVELRIASSAGQSGTLVAQSSGRLSPGQQTTVTLVVSGETGAESYMLNALASGSADHPVQTIRIPIASQSSQP